MPASSTRILACASLILSCLSASPVHARDARPIELGATQIQSLHILTTPVVMAETLPLARLPAEVVAPLDSVRTVSTPFAGIVSRVLVDEGSRVAAGAALARVHSRDFLAARADLARARSEASLGDRQAKRDATLLAEGIIARSRAEESAARAVDAQARHAQARDALASVVAVAGGEYELRAPVAGRVLRRSITPGQSVNAFEPAFTIAGGEGVDVLLQAPPEHAGQYRLGIVVRMEDGASGVLVAAAAAIEPGQQSLRLRAHLPDGGRWLIGQRGTATLELPLAEDAMRIPASAVWADGKHAQVFVANGTSFRAVDVERLGGDGKDAIVRGPLGAGDAVVSSGASVLKSLQGE